MRYCCVVFLLVIVAAAGCSDDDGEGPADTGQADSSVNQPDADSDSGDAADISAFVNTWSGQYEVELVFSDDSKIDKQYDEPLVVEQGANGGAHVILRPDADQSCEIEAAPVGPRELDLSGVSCDVTFEGTYVLTIDEASGSMTLADDDTLALDLAGTGSLDGDPVEVTVQFR